MTNLIRVAGVAVLASAAFVGSSALVKFIGAGGYPSPEIAWFRGAGGLVFLVMGWRAIWPLDRLADPWGHLARGVLGALTILCLMHAVVALPLALVFTIYYARVLLMIPLAGALLGEIARPGVWMAAVTGLVGVAVALLPSLDAPERWTGVAAVVLAALFSAGSQVMVTRLTRTNPPETIVGVFAVVATIMLAFPAVPVWVSPSEPIEWLALVGVSALAVAAQWLVTLAYGAAGAGFVAPFSYLEIPMGAVVGFLLAREVPGWWEMGGGGLVICATAYLTWRSSRGGTGAEREDVAVRLGGVTRTRGIL